MRESAVRVGLVFPELLGTYGDGGNAIVLAQRLRWRDLPAEIVRIGVEDPLPEGGDVYVLGGGPGAGPVGRVKVGYGNGDGRIEGVVAGHIVGTYLHGPALARNPALADLLLSWVVGALEPIDEPLVDRLRTERLEAALG